MTFPYKYSQDKWRTDRYPGEPHQVDPHCATKRRIERLREELNLQHQIAPLQVKPK
jgi:hypothetical protein